MTRLMTMSTFAAVLSVAIATNANAFPIAGADVASPHGPYVAPASFHFSPPDTYAGDAAIGGAYGYGGRALVGGARAGHDVWGHWSSYYGPMVHAP